jgi:hypothetical protein
LAIRVDGAATVTLTIVHGAMKPGAVDRLAGRGTQNWWIWPLALRPASRLATARIRQGGLISP